LGLAVPVLFLCTVGLACIHATDRAAGGDRRAASAAAHGRFSTG